MRLADIMTPAPITVGMDERLEAVKQVFDSRGFHHLLVVGADKRLCGIVSDRDLLRALSPFVGTLAETTRDTASLNKRVHQIMSRTLFTLTADHSLVDGSELLLRHGVSCIPIVDQAFHAIGIVSWRDILRSVAASAV